MKELNYLLTPINMSNASSLPQIIRVFNVQCIHLHPNTGRDVIKTHRKLHQKHVQCKNGLFLHLKVEEKTTDAIGKQMLSSKLIT